MERCVHCSEALSVRARFAPHAGLERVFPDESVREDVLGRRYYRCRACGTKLLRDVGPIGARWTSGESVLT